MTSTALIDTSAAAERPAEFDARVMAYVPGLRALACRMVPRDFREDLVTDTIMYALANWRKFREDGGFWNWLAWTMRGIATNDAEKAVRARRRAQFVPIDECLSLATAPTQETYTDLSRTMDRLHAIKYGDVLTRRAMGDTLHEVAAARGVSPERVRQVENKARTRIRKKSQLKAVA